MKQIIKYESAPAFKKFYLKNLFTNELEECTEKEFDEIVVTFRNVFEMEYDGPNRQVFKNNGEIEAVRER